MDLMTIIIKKCIQFLFPLNGGREGGNKNIILKKKTLNWGRKSKRRSKVEKIKMKRILYKPVKKIPKKNLLFNSEQF